MAGPADKKSRATKRRTRRDPLHSCPSSPHQIRRPMSEEPSQTTPSRGTRTSVPSRAVPSPLRPSSMLATTAALLVCVLRIVGGEVAMMGSSHERRAARTDTAPHGWRTARFLASDRASKIDVSSLICQLGDPTRVGSSSSSWRPEVKPFVIPFYYALGTKGNDTDADMDYVERFHLQQLIFESISEDIAWCYSISSGQLRGNGERRRQTLSSSSAASGSNYLGDVEQNSRTSGGAAAATPHQARQLHQSERNEEDRRRLSILSVASGPTQPNVGKCPDSTLVKDKTKQYGAGSCRTVRGSVLINAHASDNLEYMAAVILDSLESSMNKYELWQEWQVELPDLAFLLYLGDTYEDVYLDSSYTDDPIVNFNVSNSTGNETGGGARGVFGDNTAGALVLLLGVGLPVTAALILFAAVVQKQRRSTMTAKDFGLMSSEFVLVGTGDPPGSFHEGLYHYMLHGTRYLSTNCEGCLETRRNSFYTDNNLGSIPEDREYEEDILITADSKDLGGKTSTMDVHKCSSATCKRCLYGEQSKRVFFIPSMRMQHHASAAMEDQVYTIPEHAEV